MKKEHLDAYEGKNFTGFLVNVHETSTGVYYDMDLISDFCRRNGLVLLVDAISSFLADDFFMEKWGVGFGSHRFSEGLSPAAGTVCPGAGERAVERVKEHTVRSIYFDRGVT